MRQMKARTPARHTARHTRSTKRVGRDRFLRWRRLTFAALTATEITDDALQDLIENGHRYLIHH
jgi:hypothetical protein